MKRSTKLMGCLALFLVAALSGCAPRDQEECIARAAKEAKTNATFKVLVRNCESEFPAKRRDDGTYAYYDAQSEEWIDVSGPQLSDRDVAKIEELRSQKIQNSFEDQSRKKNAAQGIAVERFDISCEGSLCWNKNLTVILKNNSEYTASGITLAYEIGENLDCTGTLGKNIFSDISMAPGEVASVVKKLDGQLQQAGLVAEPGPEGVTTGCIKVKAVEAIKLPAPEVGFIDDGYRFLGGDPSDPKRWEEINGANNSQ